MNTEKKAMVITDTVKVKKKAVVIDDDMLVCRIIAKMLSDRGIEPLEVTNGTDAEAILRKEGNNLAMAVVDLILPHGPSGWDIIDIIRNNADTCKLPVVVVTGARMSSNEITRLRGKADSVICKEHFTVDNFVRVLDGLL